MNQYALYCQDTKQSFGPCTAMCNGNYEMKLSNAQDNLFNIRLSMQLGSRFALVDPNGSVIMKNLRVVKIDHTLGTNKLLVRII